MSVKIKLNNVRLSFAHLFEKHSSAPNIPPKFSAALLIPKDDHEQIKLINTAIKDALTEGAGKFNGKIPPVSQIRNLLRDGDESGRPEYEGMYFINSSNNERPIVIGKKLEPLTERSQIDSGDYANVILNLYAYNVSGNKGVGAALSAVQLAKLGERFTGSIDVNDEFDVLDGDSEDDEFDYLN